jgi:hypothetical protein
VWAIGTGLARLCLGPALTRRSSFSDIPRSQSVRYAATSPSFEFTDVQRPRGQKKKGALKEIKGALNKIFKGLFKS